jgi:hypothetical protein
VVAERMQKYHLPVKVEFFTGCYIYGEMNTRLNEELQKSTGWHLCRNYESYLNGQVNIDKD